jgi:hypothetical protein
VTTEMWTDSAATCAATGRLHTADIALIASSKGDHDTRIVDPPPDPSGQNSILAKPRRECRRHLMRGVISQIITGTAEAETLGIRIK